MRLLICGSRNWSDLDLMVRAIQMYTKGVSEPIQLMHGGARGADRLTDQAAERLNLASPEVYFADWDTYGRQAGFVRNQRMLENRPDAVLAFKDNFQHSLRSGGTEDMVARAIGARIETMLFQHRADGEAIVRCIHTAQTDRLL